MKHNGESTADGISVLLVDDREDDISALFAIFSELPQVRLVQESSGQAALRALLSDEFALILLDAAMPRVDFGSEHAPVIFLADAGQGRASILRGHEALAAVDFLERPIDPRLLCNKLAIFIELARRGREIRRQIDLRDQAARIREEFLSIASHELRTPLAALKLQVQSLERELRRTPIEIARLSAKVAVAQRQVERLTRLINELLDASRIESGRLTLDREQTDLGELVCDVIARHQDEIERSGSSIDLALSTGVIGEWDRLALDQVVTNLLQNAIKYGRARPIHVTLESAGDVARIEVKDQGIGIHEGDHARIFGRFERAVSSRAYGGMGLGLFIVDKILKAHEGTITVRSELGEGSIFVVELPLSPWHLRAPSSRKLGAGRPLPPH